MRVAWERSGVANWVRYPGLLLVPLCSCSMSPKGQIGIGQTQVPTASETKMLDRLDLVASGVEQLSVVTNKTNETIGANSGDNVTTRLERVGVVLLGALWIVIDRRRFHRKSGVCRDG